MSSPRWLRSAGDRHERASAHSRRQGTDVVTQQHTQQRGPSNAPAEQSLRPDMQLAGQCPAGHPMQPPGGLYLPPHPYLGYPQLVQLQPACGPSPDNAPDYTTRSAGPAPFFRAAVYPAAPPDCAMQPYRAPYMVGPGNVPIPMVAVYQPLPPHASFPPRQPPSQASEARNTPARSQAPFQVPQPAPSTNKGCWWLQHPPQQQQHPQLYPHPSHQAALSHSHSQQQQQQQQQPPLNPSHSQQHPHQQLHHSHQVSHSHSQQNHSQQQHQQQQPARSKNRKGGRAAALQHKQTESGTDADSSCTANVTPAGPSDADSDESCTEVARRVREREVQATAGPEVCDSWDWLAEGFLRDVVRHLDLPSICSFRLTCQRWRTIADRSVQRLQLSKAKVHNVVAQFPAATHVDMSGCQNVRNRNVLILARSELKLRTLSVGHSSAGTYGKPRVTNQALAAIADLTGLESLTLGDCGAITNNGMSVLTALTKLTAVSIVRCPRIADKGLSILAAFPLLERLDVTGCVKVTDQTLSVAATLPALRSLRTGYTRISGTGIRRLAQAASLTSLYFHAEDVPDSALMAIAGLPRLQELSIAQCYSMSGEGVLAAARSFSCLRALNLRGTPLGEDHLSQLPLHLPHLTELQVRGIDVSHRAVKSLAKLSNLQRLSLDASNFSMHPNHMASLSTLSSLTALEVHRVRGRAGMLGPIAALPRLSHLHLADCPYDRDPLCIALEPQASMLPGLPDYPALTHLSLSHFALPLGPMMRLLAALKKLQELRLDTCRGVEETVPVLAARYPQVHIYQPKASSSQTFMGQPAFA